MSLIQILDLKTKIYKDKYKNMLEIIPEKTLDNYLKLPVLFYKRIYMPLIPINKILLQESYDGSAKQRIMLMLLYYDQNIKETTCKKKNIADIDLGRKHNKTISFSKLIRIMNKVYENTNIIKVKFCMNSKISSSTIIRNMNYSENTNKIILSNGHEYINDNNLKSESILFKKNFDSKNQKEPFKNE